MGQVPTQSEAPYLIIGNGRLAKHIKHYFDLLEIPYLNWFRKSKESPQNLVAQSSKILVLINDDEIESFIAQIKSKFEDKTWIHCSGLLSIPFAESAHPLMTFPNELYDIETYEQIPFITEKGKRTFNDLFPELKNENYAIEPELKPLYHSWCVMSGNFTTILWNRFFEVIESKFGINKRDVYPYLNKITQNLMTSESPLTGPLARNDKGVIEKNLQSLKDEPFAEIYKAFVNTYKKLKESEAKK